MWRDAVQAAGLASLAGTAAEVLDVLVQAKRNERAAVKLMRKLLKKQGFAPSAIVTDKLMSHTIGHA